MLETDGINELNNEIAMQRQHENRCTTCNGTGRVITKLSAPFSNGDKYEEMEEVCPVCRGNGKSKNYTLRFHPGEDIPQKTSPEVMKKLLSRIDLDGCTSLEISDELKKIRLGLSSAFFPQEKEVIMQAEKRLTRKD